MRSRTHDDAMAELYRSDPALAALSSLTAILKAMGMRLAVQPLAPSST